MQSLSLSVNPPLSLYIHIPWCVKKCPYCDFNSHTQPENIPEEEYVNALIDDLSLQVPKVWGRKLQSIFIGGGTPSLLSGKAMDRLLSGVRALIPFNGEIEITMEANPGTAESQKFKDFFAAGVNRLSLGVQSFDDNHLEKLGRIHSADEAKRARDFADIAGFTRINIDLMHGLPNQTPKQAQSDLEQAIALQTDHLSWYQLTLEPNTLFHAKPPKLPDEDSLSDIQDLGESILESAGFKRYEISAFAKDDLAQSRHNLNYWTFGDYLAIGAGAHGKVTLPAENRVLRYDQFRHPKDYLDKNKSYSRGKHEIVSNEIALEFMMNTLRLTQPIPRYLFVERTGLPFQLIEPTLQQAHNDGLVVLNDKQFQLTKLGHRYLNDLLERFMPSNRIDISILEE